VEKRGVLGPKGRKITTEGEGEGFPTILQQVSCGLRNRLMQEKAGTHSKKGRITEGAIRRERGPAVTHSRS